MADYYKLTWASTVCNRMQYTRNILFLLLLVSLLAQFAGCFTGHEVIYETTDPADYGEVTGNGRNEKVAEIICSFLPGKLEPYFSDVTYHYIAKSVDRWACECYLEFVIQDKEAYEAFLKQYVDESKTTAFAFDPSFREYSIANYLHLYETSYKEETGYPIDYADIQKILFSKDEQRIIFVLIEVADPVGTKELHVFFDRFDIDPMEYQLTAYIADEYPGGPPIPYSP